MPLAAGRADYLALVQLRGRRVRRQPSQLQHDRTHALAGGEIHERAGLEFLGRIPNLDQATAFECDVAVRGAVGVGAGADVPMIACGNAPNNDPSPITRY
jgi:hypothetical protein